MVSSVMDRMSQLTMETGVSLGSGQWTGLSHPAESSFGGSGSDMG